MVQRARQALTCLRCAKEVFRGVDATRLMAIEQQHSFVLEYLELLEKAAATRHQQRIIDTQIALNRSIHVLTMATVGLAALSVATGIVGLLLREPKSQMVSQSPQATAEPIPTPPPKPTAPALEPAQRPAGAEKPRGH